VHFLLHVYSINSVFFVAVNEGEVGDAANVPEVVYQFVGQQRKS
jgi:hypothetical protein